ncbi:MAG: Gfo/Idh/MocA family oxidoreductase [Phycisphaerales bacterium]|nr:Gfo/Idh/MocA family oxidoreductase [Phycisphaerales bacterium]
MTSTPRPGQGFIQLIPGTVPVEQPERDPRAKGVGVVGLHEGRTLLIGLETRCRFARPVAGCDISQEKVDASRRELPGLFYSTRYEEMLARPEVEIVAIYTPDHLHAEHIARAFEAGKDVICTKPLTNTLEGARHILEVGRRTGHRLLVGQSTRFFEPFRRQRALLARGGHGGLDAIEMVDAHYIHRMDWYYRKSPWVATETDWVFLGLSHPIDLVRSYLGRIRSVHAVGGRSRMGKEFKVQSRDMYLVNFVAEDGRIGRAMGHYGCHELPTARNCIECVIYAAGGTSLAQYHDMRFVYSAEAAHPVSTETGGVASDPSNSPDASTFQPAELLEITEDCLYAGRHYYFNSEVHGMHYGEFSNYADTFARALIENTPTSPELEEGVETVCVMEAVRRSAETGEVVELAPLLAEVGLI